MVGTIHSKYDWQNSWFEMENEDAKNKLSIIQMLRYENERDSES